LNSSRYEIAIIHCDSRFNKQSLLKTTESKQWHLVKDFEGIKICSKRVTLFTLLNNTDFTYNQLIGRLRTLHVDHSFMDSEKNEAYPRIIAPRPPFMTERELGEYEEIHRFVRDRRESNIVEQKVHCRFYNMSTRDVDVIWCREENEEDYIYATVPPKRYFQLMTFQGHPWIFRAAEDGERMGIHASSDNRVHYPHAVPSKKVAAKNEEISFQVVFIKSPNTAHTTLKKLCLQQISRQFSTDFVCSLPLPSNIMSEILEYYINKLVYVNALNPTTNLPEKEPAVKTVDYLKKMLTDLDAQESKIDLREKLRSNLSMASLRISDDPDIPSTSGFNSRKRILDSDVNDDPKCKRQVGETYVDSIRMLTENTQDEEELPMESTNA